MLRYSIITLLVLLALIIARDALSQNLVIKLQDMDAVAREVKAFSGTPAVNLQSQKNTTCIFYGYGRASDSAGFYRYFEYTDLLSSHADHRARAATMMRIQNKLMGYGAMDIRIYEITPGGYAEVRP